LKTHLLEVHEILSERPHASWYEITSFTFGFVTKFFFIFSRETNKGCNQVLAFLFLLGKRAFSNKITFALTRCRNITFLFCKRVTPTGETRTKIRMDKQNQRKKSLNSRQCSISHTPST
jgi:hypothetical protein